MTDFHNTKIGRQFLDGTMPELVRQLKRVADVFDQRRPEDDATIGGRIRAATAKVPGCDEPPEDEVQVAITIATTITAVAKDIGINVEDVVKWLTTYRPEPGEEVVVRWNGIGIRGVFRGMLVKGGSPYARIEDVYSKHSGLPGGVAKGDSVLVSPLDVMSTVSEAGLRLELVDLSTFRLRRVCKSYGIDLDTVRDAVSDDHLISMIVDAEMDNDQEN